MTNKEEFRANVISSRNILFGERITDGVRQCLEAVELDASLIDVGFSKAIFMAALPLVSESIRKKKYRHAAIVLDFLHNLPLDSDDAKEWDFNYFLSVELPEYLLQTKDFRS